MAWRVYKVTVYSRRRAETGRVGHRDTGTPLSTSGGLGRGGLLRGAVHLFH